jgi:gas vesicle protein
MANGGSGEFFKGFLFGGLIGAALAILYAPQSGKETREEIGKKADELAGKAREEYDNALEKTKKSYASAIERLKELELLARKKVDEVEGQVQQLTEKGKDTVEESKTRLKRALDAGVEAYKEEKEEKEEKTSKKKKA